MSSSLLSSSYGPNLNTGMRVSGMQSPQYLLQGTVVSVNIIFVLDFFVFILFRFLFFRFSFVLVFIIFSFSF